MTNPNKIAAVLHQEREAVRKNKDFISKHNTMLKNPDKYKMNYFPVDGEDLRSVRESMVQTFKQTQMEMELKMYHDKKEWAKDSELWAWFGASRERSALLHAFNLNGHPNGWTVNEMADYLQRDRTSVSRDLTECHKKGFIYRDKSDGNQAAYHPTERLINNGTWYAEYYVDLIISLTEASSRQWFIEYRKIEKQHLQKRDSLQRNK